jgi:hypothetical protein
MNIVKIFKDDSEFESYKIEFEGEINSQWILDLHKDCELKEERYSNNILIETIIHQL